MTTELELNPYEASTAKAGAVPAGYQPISAGRAALTGAVYAVIGAIVIAPLCALLFRFPVPFAGYLNGPEAVVPAVFGVVFYGLLFLGFPILGLLGSGLAIAVSRWTDKRRGAWFARLAGLSLASAFCLGLATLDWFIGPW